MAYPATRSNMASGLAPQITPVSATRTRRSFLPAEHAAYPWIVAVAILLMLVRAGLTVTVFNHTIDETEHVGAAMGLYEAHKHIVDMTHPPLAWLVAGLPLKLSGVSVPELR